MRFQRVLVLLLLAFAAYANNRPQGHTFQIGSNNEEQGSVSITSSEEPKQQKVLGEDIYQQYCIVCHRDGLIGAPKFRSEHDWRPRMEGRKLEDLVASSIKGLKAMPAKGTCSQCSKEEIESAISYMLPKS